MIVWLVSVQFLSVLRATMTVRHQHVLEKLAQGCKAVREHFLFNAKGFVLVFHAIRGFSNFE